MKHGTVPVWISSRDGMNAKFVPVSEKNPVPAHVTDYDEHVRLINEISDSLQSGKGVRVTANVTARLFGTQSTAQLQGHLTVARAINGPTDNHHDDKITFLAMTGAWYDGRDMCEAALPHLDVIQRRPGNLAVLISVWEALRDSTVHMTSGAKLPTIEGHMTVYKELELQDRKPVEQSAIMLLTEQYADKADHLVSFVRERGYDGFNHDLFTQYCDSNTLSSGVL